MNDELHTSPAVTRDLLDSLESTDKSLSAFPGQTLEEFLDVAAACSVARPGSPLALARLVLPRGFRQWPP